MLWLRSTETASALVGLMLVVVIVGASGTATAVAPPRISYQGLILDPNGAPFSGTAKVEVSIWESQTPGGTALFREAHAGVQVLDGVFQIEIGGVDPVRNPLSPGVFAVPDRFLEVSVNGEVLTPRQRITSVPFALQSGQAGDATSVGGRSAESLQEILRGVCPEGAALRVINPDGSFVCEPGLEGPRGPQGSPGLACWDLNENGECDTLFEDRNRDLACTALDCEGPRGRTGAQGEPGNLVLAGQACPTGRAVVGFDAAGGILCTEAGCPTGETDCGGFCSSLQADVNNCGSCGFTCAAGDFCREGGCEPFPDVLDNTVDVEIQASASFEDAVFVTGGPAIEIQRILGFGPGPVPDDSPGLNAESDVVFEYSGPGEATLQALRDDFEATGTTRPVVFIVRDAPGSEVFRWQLFEYGLASIGVGSEGRKRYVFSQTLVPDHDVRIMRDDFDDAFPSTESRNLATDTRTEIEGVVTGPYPTVAVDTTARTITMVFDYTEGGDVWGWAKCTARGLGFASASPPGVCTATSQVKKSISVIQETAEGVETSRTNYFGCFPIRYEQFTGFGQVQKIKERIVISYDTAVPG